MSAPPHSGPRPHAAPADPPLVSVLIPAHNEADYIGACLKALFASDPLPGGQRVEVLVLANGCTDATGAIATAQPVPQGWDLRLVELPEGGKLNALNAGDAQARGEVLIYLDADVTVERALVAQLAEALQGPAPRYASGTPQIAPAPSALTRAYGRSGCSCPLCKRVCPALASLR